MNANLRSGNHDLIDQFIYPYLSKLAKYIPKSLSPNVLTVFALLSSLTAAGSLLFITNRMSLIIAVAGLMMNVVFDGLDGIHARLTNQACLFGAFLDDLCDVVSMLFVFFAVMIHFNLTAPLFIFIFLFRITINTVFFVYESSYQSIYLPKVGLSFELFIYCIFFLICFVTGDKILFTYNFSSSYSMQFSLMKLMALGYLFILPYVGFTYYKLAKAASKRPT